MVAAARLFWLDAALKPSASADIDDWRWPALSYRHLTALTSVRERFGFDFLGYDLAVIVNQFVVSLAKTPAAPLDDAEWCRLVVYLNTPTTANASRH